MSLFSVGAGLTSSIGAASNAVGAVGNAVNVASNLGSAISNLGSAEDFGSAMRSLNLPAAGEAIGDLMGAVAEFGGDANANDWRVRLSLPKWTSFRSSPVLKPLKDAGGCVFPYTPSITVASSSKYTQIPTIHTNYLFQAFQSSDPGSITITAPMRVEDQSQGLYWIAMVHYLRSLTKMFSGSDPKAGNPPPVVFLNGYGNYVFKNVPVVVTKMSVNLAKECDYIGVEVVGSAMGALEGVTDSIGGLADTLGGAIPQLGGVTGMVSSIAGGVGQVAGLLGSLGVGGSTSGGISYVPTTSEFSITVQPVYSRDSVRKFSLDRFVQGGYLNNSFGYI